MQRSRSISNTVACSGGRPTIRTSVFGSFWQYTFPSRHSGQISPGFSCGCFTRTLSAPVKAVAGLRPCPAGPDRSGCGSVGAVPDVVFGSSTALIFSVFRRRTSLSAIACTAVLSVRPSCSFRGSRIAASIMRSSSSTSISMPEREVFFFMAGSVTRGSVASGDSPAPL